MKIMIGKIIVSDRFILVPAALSVVVAIFTAIIFISAGSFEKKNALLRDNIKEMQIHREKIVHIKEIVESKERKIGLTKVSGIVSSLEQMLNSIGIEAKAIKPLEKKRIKEFTEEDAELEVKDIDLNKIVNLFYKLENSPVPIKIKGVHMKTTFENPNTFTLNMTASLISK